MRVVVLSPGGPLYEGEVSRAAAVGEEGAFEVLEKHAPMIIRLISGEIRLSTNEGEKRFAHRGGYLWVMPTGEVKVLVR